MTQLFLIAFKVFDYLLIFGDKQIIFDKYTTSFQLRQFFVYKKLE